MTPTLVAVTGLAFTVAVTIIGAIIAALKMTFTIGKMASRFDALEKKPADPDCALQLATLNAKFEGFETLVAQQFKSLEELLHAKLSSLAHPAPRIVREKRSGTG